MNETDFYIIRLLDYFELKTVSELSERLGVTPQVITNWKIRNSIRALQKKCKELGIEKDIFSVDFNPILFTTKNVEGDHVENVNDNGIGIDKKEIKDDAKKEIKEVDEATYNLFLEAYKKATKQDELKKFRIYLMDY